MDDAQLADAAERLSSTLTAEELDETLHRITRGAVSFIPGVDHASITIRHDDGREESVAPTDPVAAQLDGVQIALRQGPGYDATHGTTSAVVSPDLADDERFPQYALTANELGIASQAGLRLFTIEGSSGVLNLYSRTKGVFTDSDGLGELFAEQSALALEQARELEAVRAAARSAEKVGRAVGIAMERYGFSERGAFAFLARLAGHHHRGLTEVADAVMAASERRSD